MREDQDSSGKAGPLLGMVSINDGSLDGIDATPPAERLIEYEAKTSGFPRNDRGGIVSHQAGSVLITLPVTADSTQSAADPNTTSTPMLPGA